MNGILSERTSDGFHVCAPRYELNIRTAEAAFDVVLGGVAVASLDLRSAVCRTADDNSVITDAEPKKPVFAGLTETADGCVLRWTGESSLWKKEYTLRCAPLRFLYHVKVSGEGRVDSVNYFSGDLSAPFHGSGYEFAEGFNPCVSWYNTEDYYFRSSVKNYRWSVLMVPPMFCYSFRTAGLSERLTLGLAAEKGEHNFHSLTYNQTKHDWDTGFFLSTDQDGHTEVKGEWTAPHILGFGADDEFDSMRKYCEYYFASGLAEVKKSAVPPRFWRGPMLCGWIEQIMEGYKRGVNPTSLAREDVYEELLRKARGMGLKPRALIIDDKWQKEYATDRVDESKWGDMRAFIDRRHAEGISTLLWFKLWDGEGWPDALCVRGDKGERRLDPSTPEFLANLDEVLHRLLSPDAGCYDCDGFKLDFAFFNPIGKGFKTCSGKYGVELLYDLMAYIYKKAKEIKPYALINCSPCHPYFAHLCDQARLHDYSYSNRDNYEDLAMRAKLFAIANPDTLIDTDNAGFNTRRDTMRWLMNQPEIGVPDLYALTPMEGSGMTGEDFSAIAALWDEYSARVDAKYD